MQILIYLASILFISAGAASSLDEPSKPLKKATYKFGDAIPVSCLNRTMSVRNLSKQTFNLVVIQLTCDSDTGEHVNEPLSYLESMDSKRTDAVRSPTRKVNCNTFRSRHAKKQAGSWSSALG